MSEEVQLKLLEFKFTFTGPGGVGCSVVVGSSVVVGCTVEETSVVDGGVMGFVGVSVIVLLGSLCVELGVEGGSCDIVGTVEVGIEVEETGFVGPFCAGVVEVSIFF